MATLATYTHVRTPELPGLFGRLIGWAVRWNAARQTRDQLMLLSDRELDDIGLSRAQIDDVAAAMLRG